jgi:cytidine deaminase
VTAALAPDDRALVRAARAVRAHAHAPYSRFKVGAALRRRDGRVFAGCNVENASLGGSICAERGAVMGAVAAGMRRGELDAIAIYTGDARSTPPCGMCLQVLVEFGPRARILLAGPRRLRQVRLADLLPEPFTDFRRR